MFAPKSGKETRERIAETSKKATEQVKETAVQVKNQVKTKALEGKENIVEAKSRIQQYLSDKRNCPKEETAAAETIEQPAKESVE